MIKNLLKLTLVIDLLSVDCPIDKKQHANYRMILGELNANTRIIFNRFHFSSRVNKSKLENTVTH